MCRRRRLACRRHLALTSRPCTAKSTTAWSGCAWARRADAVPASRFEDDPTFRRINTPVELWTTSATRMADNFLDITHFPYVHTGTFGLRQDTVVPKVELGELDDGYFGYRYEVRGEQHDCGSLASGQDGDVVERSMSSGFILPFVVRSTIRYNTGLQHIILMLSTPIDDVTSYFTFVIWRNDDFSVSAEEVIRFDLAIGAEDKRMLEKVPGLHAARQHHVGERAGRQGVGRVAPPADRADGAGGRARRVAGIASTCRRRVAGARVHEQGARARPRPETMRSQAVRTLLVWPSISPSHCRRPRTTSPPRPTPATGATSIATSRRASTVRAATSSTSRRSRTTPATHPTC